MVALEALGRACAARGKTGVERRGGCGLLQITRRGWQPAFNALAHSRLPVWVCHCGAAAAVNDGQKIHQPLERGLMGIEQHHLGCALCSQYCTALLDFFVQLRKSPGLLFTLQGNDFGPVLCPMRQRAVHQLPQAL